jgi:type III pantothenate kinase
MIDFAYDGAILVVDIGNTNIVCGIYENDKLTWFAPLLGDYSLKSIHYVAIGSVVPELSRIWIHLFQKYSSARIVDIKATSPLGLTYMVDNPSFIGADLVANAYGAWKKYHTNCIIVDLGTATTVQVVSASGLFIGAAIAPGLRTGASFLFEKAALLSEVELSSPPHVLGTNTHDALLSGIVSGHAIMIEGFINRIRMQYPELEPIKTIITGGISELLKPLVSNIDCLDKTLTLDGLHMAVKHLL